MLNHVQLLQNNKAQKKSSYSMANIKQKKQTQRDKFFNVARTVRSSKLH